jgi:hypothetical protein
MLLLSFPSKLGAGTQQRPLTPTVRSFGRHVLLRQLLAA